MYKPFIIFVSLLFLLPVAFQPNRTFSLSFDPPVPTAQTQPVETVIEFYRTYLNTLYLVDPNLVYRYSIGDSEGLQFLIDDLVKEGEIVRKLRLNQTPFAREYDAKTFERMAIPLVFRYRTKAHISIPDSEVQRVLSSYPQNYPAQELIFGWEIFVETDDRMDTSTLAKTLASIRQQLESEPFQRVALKYYWTIGTEYDGSMGEVRRGDIPDWEFDIFLAADPAARFFGPIKAEEGFLFGKLHHKYTSSTSSIQRYGESVRAIMKSQAVQQSLIAFYKTQKERLKPAVFRFDHASTRGLDQIAYRFDKYEITFRQVLARLPQYTGNPKDPRFHDAMVKHAFEDDLIILSPQAEETRKSPEYLFMAEAHRNAWLVNRYVKMQLDNLPKDEAALKVFYDEQKEKIYSRPDLVKLLVISRTRDLSEDQDPILRHSARKPDFAAALRLKKVYEKNPGLATIQELAKSDSAVKWKIDDKEVPADGLGRVLEMGIKDLPAGGIAGPLVARNEYIIVHVISRRKQPVMTFGDVQKRLPADYMIHCKRKILKDLYGTARVENFF